MTLPRGIAAGTIALFLTSRAFARQDTPRTNPPITPITPGAPAPGRTAPVRSETLVLINALEILSLKAKTTVLADSSIAYERVPQAALTRETIPAPTTTAAAPTTITAAPSGTEVATEKTLDALVKTLPTGSFWVKLYLPAPPAGRRWKGDDVSALAYAQARLFGTIGAPAADGSIEVLGRRVGKDAAPAYVSGLGLVPVYLLTNSNRQITRTPWSAASEEQWSRMSKDERKQFGEQQAAAIMALSPEDRAQMLDQIRQHDKFFDTVKDPLEKMLGHDL